MPVVLIFFWIPPSPQTMDEHLQMLEHAQKTAIDITLAVLKTFRARGISIPFPQREARLLSTP